MGFLSLYLFSGSPSSGFGNDTMNTLFTNLKRVCCFAGVVTTFAAIFSVVDVYRVGARWDSDPQQHVVVKRVAQDVVAENEHNVETRHVLQRLERAASHNAREAAHSSQTGVENSAPPTYGQATESGKSRYEMGSMRTPSHYREGSDRRQRSNKRAPARNPNSKRYRDSSYMYDETIVTTYYVG